MNKRYRFLLVYRVMKGASWFGVFLMGTVFCSRAHSFQNVQTIVQSQINNSPEAERLRQQIEERKKILEQGMAASGASDSSTGEKNSVEGVSVSRVKRPQGPDTEAFDIRFTHSKSQSENGPSVLNQISFQYDKTAKSGYLLWGMQLEVDPSDTVVNDAGQIGTNAFPLVEFKLQGLEFSPEGKESADGSNTFGITLTPTVNWYRVYRNNVPESYLDWGVEVKREWEMEIQESMEITLEAVVGLFGSKSFSALREGRAAGVTTTAEFGVELEKQFKNLLFGTEAGLNYFTRPTGERHLSGEVELWIDPGKKGGWYLGTALKHFGVYRPLPGNVSERHAQFFVGFRGSSKQSGKFRP